ncbi:hypothetical protein RHGRI_030858 [Rhododendron griersonianum]|uniref:Uncharacterized protein n=1 Tax=Rhododendron griersonianum TaxID=479676 RepID=A0AAV6I5K6_9ERIC|nr:hypothetical protein RHGRI_030858 [Rhododendron griersonianum]
MQVKKENQDDDPTFMVEICEDMERMTLGFSLKKLIAYPKHGRRLLLLYHLRKNKLISKLNPLASSIIM